MPTLRDVGDALAKFGGGLHRIEIVGLGVRYQAVRRGRFCVLGTDLSAEVAPQAVRAMCTKLVIPKSLFRRAVSGGDVEDEWATYLARGVAPEQ